MKVFIVMARSGEYSDREEWLVTGYSREKDAKTHVEQAEEYARAWCAAQNYINPTLNPFDRSARFSYTGIHYWYEEIEIKDRFTTPEILQ